MITNRTLAQHYKWGKECDAWSLFQSPGAIVKEEAMPPGTEESLHYHETIEQVFYLLKGEAIFYLDDDEYRLKEVTPYTLKRMLCIKLLTNPLRL